MVFLYVGGQSGCKDDKTEVFEVVFRINLVETGRFRVLGRGIRRLCGGDLPGREHTGRYLRHKYCMGCSAGTIGSNVCVLHAFLSFLKDTARTHLEQIS